MESEFKTFCTEHLVTVGTLGTVDTVDTVDTGHSSQEVGSVWRHCSSAGHRASLTGQQQQNAISSEQWTVGRPSQPHLIICP